MLKNFSYLLFCLYFFCHFAWAQEFYGSDIIDANIGSKTLLNSTQQKKLSPLTQDNHIKIVIFGYTSCPDVCPTNLITYADTFKLLGEHAKKVKLFFITVDPERDTQAKLQGYLKIFNQKFIGLVPKTGKELEQFKKDWKITASKVFRKDGPYTVDHSTGTYLINQKGQVNVYEPHGQTAKQIVHDIKLLLQ